MSGYETNLGETPLQQGNYECFPPSGEKIEHKVVSAEVSTLITLIALDLLSFTLITFTSTKFLRLVPTTLLPLEASWTKLSVIRRYGHHLSVFSY